MRYYEQFMEHIEYEFNALSKTVLRHEAIVAWWDLNWIFELEKFTNDILEACKFKI